MKEKKHLLNGEITSPMVKIIIDGSQDTISLEHALNMADEQDLDLVQMGEQENMAVCKLMDYGKLLYDTQKKHKAQNKNKRDLKEIYFRPNTDTADVNNKLSRIKEFLQKGHEVKVGVKFKGREISHKEIGVELLNNIQGEVLKSSVGKVKSSLAQQGRSLSISFAP